MTETDDYRLQARASFDLLAKRLEFVAKMQAEYGKWVVATLLFLHTSAIAGLLYKSEASSHPRALGCFAIGAAFAVITGAAAWINFTAAMFIYDKFCDVRMLVNSDRWPKADEVKTQHLWSCCAMYAAIACALISLIFWVTGAGLLLLKEFTDARMIQMALAKILSLAGILVELVGFAILAFELLRTNKDIASYANAIANKITTATTIIGRDSTPGETGGAELNSQVERWERYLHLPKSLAIKFLQGKNEPCLV